MEPSEGVGLGVSACDTEGVAEALGVEVPEDDNDGDSVWLSVAVRLPVGEALGVSVPVPEVDAVDVALAVKLPVGEELAVSD